MRLTYTDQKKKNKRNALLTLGVAGA